MYRVFFDTDVLLDLSLPGRPQKEEARKVLSLCNGGGDLGMMSSLSLKDAYFLLTRHYGESVARDWVRGLMELLAVAPVGGEECAKAVDSNEPDFEDGLIRAAAELNGADFIITRDKDAFAKCRIRAVTAAEYLAIVEPRR